mmetsp:Transcript_22609/g.61736  ORF Transcript_22609/g.61736 Transcript_22609/m.61736 type:complete len:244 (+) Transcript_22609:693-1424(+)
MSCERVVMDPLLVDIWPARSFLRVSQELFALSHSDCVDVCLAVKSLFRLSRVVTISLEWYLYPGSLGSTPPCRKASTAGRLLVTTRPIASASAKPSRTEARIESNEAGFEAFIESMALPKDFTALERSAMDASNSAVSERQRACASERSAASSSCFFLRPRSSLAFVAFEATLDWMSALSLSTSSLLAWIAKDLLAVLSLQKHAKESYVAASAFPSLSTLVFMSSSSTITFSTGVTPASSPAA